MTEFEGTKGNWELDIPKYGESNGFASVLTEDGIITCYNGLTEEGVHPKSLANALLISKAPKMLEMLIGIVTAKDLGLLDKADFTKIEQLIKEATQI